MYRIIAIASLLISGLLQGQTLNVDSNRIVRAVGEVNSSMFNVINQLDELSKKSEDPILLLINSPGGSVLVGNLIINAMHAAQARGVELHCVSTMFAASMAFQFYVECDHRYAMKHTKLLFHPPRIFYQGILLQSEMENWIRELAHIESKMIPVIQRKLDMKTEEFEAHYHNETLWDAEDLLSSSGNPEFLTIVEDVQGVDNLFQLVPTFGTYNNGDLIWIYPELVIWK